MKPRKSPFWGLICALILLDDVPCHAEYNPPASALTAQRHARLSFGIGAGGNGLALCGSYSHSPIVAGVFGAVRAVTGCSLDTVEPAEASDQVKLRHATEVGVLFGKEIERPGWHAHVAAGVGWTWGEKRTRVSTHPYAVKSDDFSVPSISVGMGLFFSPVLPVGFGLTGFGNLNSEKSYIGVLVCIELRRFEPFRRF